MPFAEDYEAAAAALDSAALTTGTLIEPARTAMGSGVMVGGQLTIIVTDELEAANTILSQVTTELAELAATCRERAETCRAALAAEQAYAASYADYETQLRGWQDRADAHAAGTDRRDPGEAPRAPQPPPAPPSWANR